MVAIYTLLLWIQPDQKFDIFFLTQKGGHTPFSHRSFEISVVWMSR